MVLRVPWDWTDGCYSDNLTVTWGPIRKGFPEKVKMDRGVLDRSGVSIETGQARRRTWRKLSFEGLAPARESRP